MAKSQEPEQKLTGRYTLEQAARVLEREAGERFETVLDSLISAAKSGELPMYNPGENFRRDYTAEKTKRVRDFYEEVHSVDLNEWLEANQPYVKYRFPAPPMTAKGSTDLPEVDRPVPRQRWQEDKIRAALRSLGIDIQAMPPNVSGKRGTKSLVKAECKKNDPSAWQGSTVFDKAWQRCLDDGSITYKKD